MDLESDVWRARIFISIFSRLPVVFANYNSELCMYSTYTKLLQYTRVQKKKEKKNEEDNEINGITRCIISFLAPCVCVWGLLAGMRECVAFD